MTIASDDLRAAVAAGVLNEAQAVEIIRLADERQGYRAARTQTDEPFELFKGFNEIFIVIGLSILYAGWTTITGFSVMGSSSFSYSAILFALIQMAFLIPMTVYFTLKRRMVAPSILLSIFFAIAAFQFGVSLMIAVIWQGGIGFTLEYHNILDQYAFAMTALLLSVHWYYFRIPFSILLLGLSVFFTALCLFGNGINNIEDYRNFFVLSTTGGASFVTLGFGVCAFCVAMWFDTSDPHRVTRRASNGFWLHVLAAPAIVNSIALTLYQSDSVIGMLVLLVFLILMAAVAIVIDRRSFLISGIGYMIALIFTVLDGGYGLMVLLIGFGLVLLGATWEKLRCWMLNKLPMFPGKDKLPPWRWDHEEA